MTRLARFALLLVGGKCSGKPATKPQVASGSARGDAATAVKKLIDGAALVAKFAELRDDRALGCLIERTEKPNTTSEVLSAVVEYSPSPVVVRAVGLDRKSVV